MVKKTTEEWIALIGVGALSTLAAAGFGLAIYAAWLFHDLPNGANLVDYRPPTSTRVFAWDGTLIGEFSKERRIYVTYDRIPKKLAYAFLAAEDRNFFQHGGIDVQGLGRALITNAGAIVSGRRMQGASTITQQVAKNVVLSGERTLGRKLKEAIMARRLEANLDKSQILELYLNEIYLGYRSFGVASAAYNYFGKSLDELSLAEIAYLAALPKGPDNYHPIKRKAQALIRRNWIIKEMADLGWVSREEADEALKTDLVVQLAPQRAKYKDGAYFVEEVRRRALGLLGDKVFEGGYYLRTTMDPKIQSQAQASLMKGVEAYDRRHGWRGASANDDSPEWKQKAALMPIPAERQAWVLAHVVSVAGGSARIELSDGTKGGIDGADMAWAKAGRGLKPGDIVYVEPRSGSVFNLRQVPAVNGALVAIDPWTGRVLAMVGGYSFSLSKFNRATQAFRQPGSSFKPFVYASALEHDYTPATVVLDAPIEFKDNRGNVWRPENYEKTYYGPQTLRRGLEMSRNVMTVRLAQMVGMKAISEDAVKFGAVNKMEPVLAMALGAGETTPFQITAAYSAFVNGGYRIQPHLIEVMHDRNGKAVYRADARKCPDECHRAFSGDGSPRLTQQGQQVMDPITAYQITSFLQGVVQRGTAYAARSLGRTLAGKTGTTNEYRSAWFVGYSPDLVVGVFIGFDGNQPLGHGETGATAALPMWTDFMGNTLKDRPDEPFRKPAKAKFLMVRGREEAFRPGTEPKVVVAPVVPGLLPGSGPLAPGDAPSTEPGKTPPPPKKTPEDLQGLY